MPDSTWFRFDARPAAARPNKASVGFTLVELLVVIAIIGVLVALLLPAVQAAREAARRSQCQNNMRQIGIGMQNYHDAHKSLPQTTYYNESGLPQKGGLWTVLIMPFIEQQNLYNAFDLTVDNSMANRANREVIKTVIPGFTCPSDEESSKPIMTGRAVSHPGVNPDEVMGLWYPVSMGPTSTDTCVFCPGAKTSSSGTDNYCCQGWNYGTQSPVNNSVGMFGRYPVGFKFSQVTDGLSSTFLAGETLPAQCSYISAFGPNAPLAGTAIPINLINEEKLDYGSHLRSCGYKSRHAGGANMVMGDASVQFFSTDVDYALWNALGTRAGDEARSLAESH